MCIRDRALGQVIRASFGGAISLSGPGKYLIKGNEIIGNEAFAKNEYSSGIYYSCGGGISLGGTLNTHGCEDVTLEDNICLLYTSLDSSKTKYNLDYYVKMAKALEAEGSHIIGIKDMSGLLKPMAAYKLITALKDEVNVPIHLHTCLLYTSRCV